MDNLKSDKIIVGKAAHFEKQMDGLIEEQVKLKEEELSLMKKVKTAQKKNVEGSENRKTLQPALSLKARATSAKNRTVSGSRGLSGHDENTLRILKEQLFNSNRQIQSLQHQIEDYRNSNLHHADSSYLYE